MTVLSGDYSIILYEPRWKDQVVKLQTLLWDPDPAVNAAYFDWKYQHHPGSANPLVYLAIQENQAVAMRGFGNTRWQAGHPAALFDFLRAGDLVVAPGHRGRWLLQRIMAFAEKDLAARNHKRLLNLSASPSTYLGSLRQGWYSIGTFDTMRRNTWTGRATTFARQNLARMPLLWRLALPEARATSPRRAFAKLDRLIGQRPARIGAVTASHELRAAAMANLIQRLDWDGRLREVRTAEFLEWRYKNPLGQNRNFYHGAPELEGYLVLHARRRASPLNTPQVNIVDWEAVDDRVREELLRAVITACRPRSLDLWAASCSPATRELLMACGFRSIDTSRGLSNYRPSVLIKNLPAGAPGLDGDALAGRCLRDPENWDLRMLYSDNY
jgi:GNAT superfamily N-acetyltransferase